MLFAQSSHKRWSSLTHEALSLRALKTAVVSSSPTRRVGLVSSCSRGVRVEVRVWRVHRQQLAVDELQSLLGGVKGEARDLGDPVLARTEVLQLKRVRTVLAGHNKRLLICWRCSLHLTKNLSRGSPRRVTGGCCADSRSCRTSVFSSAMVVVCLHSINALLSLCMTRTCTMLKQMPSGALERMPLTHCATLFKRVATDQ